MTQEKITLISVYNAKNFHKRAVFRCNIFISSIDNIILFLSLALKVYGKTLWDRGINILGVSDED
jgi:hypothetical protein